MRGIAGCYQEADGPVGAELRIDPGAMVASMLYYWVPDRLISDEQVGREDHAKQVWQLLTLELWYRNMRSLGVAGK
jgi:hypothetical protein